MPKKCISICKQFPKEDCNAPRCRYIDGSKRKYCRISYKYKMTQPNCKVTRKYKKSEEKMVAQNKIRQFINRSSRVLQLICANSGECLAFGRKISEINAYFKNFIMFDYSVGNAITIGEPSDNGFIKQITFERNGYKANTILKSSQKPDSDNLVYEYIVGTKFINRIIRKFPCFIETYGLYFYKSPNHWNYMKDNDIPDILRYINLQSSINYSKACTDSRYAAILMQHISSGISIEQVIASNIFINIIKYDLIYILFIVYQALAAVSTKFTHYDLHPGNVMIYEPVKGKYIQYIYHLNDGSIISFYCPYIPKIIDYGRSFFDNGNINSSNIYDKVCDTKACDPCGEDNGFIWLDPKAFLHISSSMKNESHDLRLLNGINNSLNSIMMENDNKNDTYKSMHSIVSKVRYGVGIDYEDQKQFGTKENTKLHLSGETIANVTDAYIQLKTHIEKQGLINENQAKYSNPDDQLGILHIYANGNPMVYESSSSK